MSRFATLRGTIVFIIMSLLASYSFVSVAGAASAVPGVPEGAPKCVIEFVSGDPDFAPPPDCADLSGSDQDVLWVTTSEDVGYRVVETGRSMPNDGTLVSSGGRSALEVRVLYDNEYNIAVVAVVYSLTFNTEVTAVEAPLGLTAGYDSVCDSRGHRKAWLEVTNPADASLRQTGVFNLRWIQYSGDGHYFLPAPSIADGESYRQEVLLKRMGRWDVEATSSSFSTIWLRLLVPECGDSSSGELRATAKRLGRCGSGRFKVVVDARAVRPVGDSSTVRILNGRSVRSLKVVSGEVGAVQLRRVKRHSRVVVKSGAKHIATFRIGRCGLRRR